MREEEVVVAAVVNHVGALDVVGAAIVGNVGGGAFGGGWGGLHSDLVNIVPEGAKVHEVASVFGSDQVGVDGVVSLAAVT